MNRTTETEQRHANTLKYLKNKARLLDTGTKTTDREAYARSFLLQAIAIYTGEEVARQEWEHNGVFFHMVES